MSPLDSSGLPRHEREPQSRSSPGPLWFERPSACGESLAPIVQEFPPRGGAAPHLLHRASPSVRGALPSNRRSCGHLLRPARRTAYVDDHEPRRHESGLRRCLRTARARRDQLLKWPEPRSANRCDPAAAQIRAPDNRRHSADHGGMVRRDCCPRICTGSSLRSAECARGRQYDGSPAMTVSPDSNGWRKASSTFGWNSGIMGQTHQIWLL